MFLPETRACLPCLKNNKEVSMARAERGRGREDGDEGTECDRPVRSGRRWIILGTIKRVRAGEAPDQICTLESSLWLRGGRQAGGFEM